MSRKLEIELEMRIAMEAVKGLLEAGYSVGVNDGESLVLRGSTNPEEIKAALFSTDEDYLIAYDPENREVGWVYLVWGNVESVISDYTINLEPALESANALADEYS